LFCCKNKILEKYQANMRKQEQEPEEEEAKAEEYGTCS
jgi:hypothetical protein